MNPAPGRTLREWAIDRTQHGHRAYCPNRSRLGVYACNCGYEMAWEQCFAMLPIPVPHEPNMSEL